MAGPAVRVFQSVFLTVSVVAEESSSNNNNNNNRRLVTLAEHTSDHGKQTNSSTKEKGEHG